jgi:hypothetical protein
MEIYESNQEQSCAMAARRFYHPALADGQESGGRAMSKIAEKMESGVAIDPYGQERV